MSTTPEGKVKKDIKKVLDKANIFYFLPVSNGMGRGGVSDFICCWPTVITQDMVGKTVGVFLAVEAKAPGKDATDRQDDFLKKVEDHGGIGYVADDAVLLDQALERGRAVR